MTTKQEKPMLETIQHGHSDDELRKPNTNLWQPRWHVDVGGGCELGIASDDGCFVVLYPTSSGQWQPGTRIPIEVAKRLGSLASHYTEDSIGQ